ncbi:hypothetical protein ABZ479_15455 [Streptomyces sp. NPDC005722]
MQHAMLRKLGRVIDWAGLIPAGLLLFVGIRDYRDGGSIGWLLLGASLVLVSVWTIYRGMSRGGGGKATESPEGRR